MSVHFSPQTLFEATEADWLVTASAWRGSCLELFSRAEQSIDDCIAALEQGGRDLGANIHHPGIASRIRVLCAFLESEDFSHHRASCIRKLESWSSLMAQRALLAHGTMSANERGCSFRFREHKGKKGVVEREGKFDRFQMLSLLHKLGSDQIGLHQQLGQIKADARRRG